MKILDDSAETSSGKDVRKEPSWAFEQRPDLTADVVHMYVL